MTWTLEQAVSLCHAIEAVVPTFGCHVALTGGVLYKSGERKDLDLLFYRIRQVDKIDVVGLFNALAALGVVRPLEDILCNPEAVERWCIKATYGGRNIDCFFPEFQGGSYGRDDDAATVPSPPTDDLSLEWEF